MYRCAGCDAPAMMNCACHTQLEGTVVEEKPTLPQHDHTEVIKAWRHGAKVEYQNMGGEWVEVDRPAFFPETVYRVKVNVASGEDAYHEEIA